MTDPHRLWLRPIKVLEEREAVRRPDANGEVSAPGRKRPGAQLGTEGAKGVHVIRRHAGNPCDSKRVGRFGGFRWKGFRRKRHGQTADWLYKRRVWAAMALACFHNCMYDTGLVGMGSGYVLVDCLMYTNLACREGLNCGWQVIGKRMALGDGPHSSMRSHDLDLI
jgi:hypothetical protein